MNKMMIYANPVRFMALSAKLWPPCAALTLVLGLIGLYLVFTAPPDYQQGITVRILFVHVPAAWMAMMIYGFIAAASFAAFVWRAPLSDIAAQSAALPGIGFTFLALASGSLWGRPIWGHFWAWDARLVSVLILFFSLSGLHRSAGRDRRSRPRCNRGEIISHRGRDQSADHKVLGGLVEHIASTGIDFALGGPGTRAGFSVATGFYGECCFIFIHHDFAGAHARRDHAPPHRVPDSGARLRGQSHEL